MFRLVALFLALVSASAVVAPGHVASVSVRGLNSRWDFGPASALVLSCLVFHSVHNSFVRGLFEGSLNKWWGSIVLIFLVSGFPWSTKSCSRKEYSTLGLRMCKTVLSSRNMLHSSMSGMVLGSNFLMAELSFLSSATTTLATCL